MMLHKAFGLTEVFYDEPNGFYRVRHSGNMGDNMDSVEEDVDVLFERGMFQKILENKVKEIGSPDYGYELEAKL